MHKPAQRFSVPYDRAKSWQAGSDDGQACLDIKPVVHTFSEIRHHWLEGRVREVNDSIVDTHDGGENAAAQEVS